MAETSYQSRDADIDIGRLFGALWRHKLLIAVGTLVVAVLAWLLFSAMTPQYRADARVLIEQSESVFTRPEQQGASDAVQLNREVVTSQVEIITSSDLLLQVAEELDLAALPEFNSNAQMTAFERGLIELGLAADPTGAPTEKRVLDAMRKRLTVYAIENSSVIVIDFRSSDPALAARVPNALAEAYVALESQAQLANTQAASDFLAGEIAELESSVREAEAAIAGFRASSGLLVADEATTLTTQQLAELSSELSRVRADRASVEARLRSVEAALAGGAALDTLPDVIASPLIGRLAEQQSALNAELADLSTTLLPGHPRIRALRSQIADLEARQRQQAERILAGLRTEVDIARDREEEINAALNTLKAASAQANEREVELRALERQAASQRALLESYLARFREAQARDDGQYAPAEARIISRATVPIEPSFPNVLPMTLAATIIGLLLMIVGTLLRELFSGRAMVLPATAEETADGDRREPGVSVSGTGEPPGMQAELEPPAAAPIATALTASAISAPSPSQPANDNFGLDAVAETLVRRGARRALMVAPLEGVGAQNAVAITRLLNDTGLRAILVDLAGSGRAGTSMLGGERAAGITDLLAAQASYSDVIHRDRGSRAHVMPAGHADPQRALSGIERLPMILDGLEDAYDMIVVDCGTTDADGLRRLVSDDAEIVLSVDGTMDDGAIEMAQNLSAGGFEDALILAIEVQDDAGPAVRRAAF